MSPALAYGLALSADGLDTGMAVRGGEWPTVTIHQDRAGRGLVPSRLDADRAELELADGSRWLELSRRDARAVFHGPPIPVDELAHPYLWPVASIFSRWLGREAFHAGALVLDGGAWALLGPKEAGKSSLLAAWARHGGAVLADDLVVVDGLRALAGPRWVDLRRPLPGSAPDALIPTRAATRLRLGVGAIAPTVPFRGWVFLGWGRAVGLSPVPASVCLARLARWRAWGGLDSDAAGLLSLAGLPAYELIRPQRWASLEATLTALEDLGAGHAERARPIGGGGRCADAAPLRATAP